ncbi:hypothetical protein D3C86_2132900 [compost metagenome]
MDNSRQRQSGHNRNPLTSSDECQRGKCVVILMNSLNPGTRRVTEAPKYCSVGR